MTNNESLPATKADLNHVRTELKGDIDNLRTELKGDIDNVRTELKAVRTELKQDISGVVGEIVKLDIRITKIEENMATKDDINRILNIIDSFINEIRDYRSKDILRGEAIMEHDKKIKDHETRLQNLESR